NITTKRLAPGRDFNETVRIAPPLFPPSPPAVAGRPACKTQMAVTRKEDRFVYLCTELKIYVNDYVSNLKRQS
ncbi:MAG TPA: hypothetical protein VFR08_13620, partial [Candidatus Angelobacter sp.]|nr:hypothetical protein [Candidatus Angelobacter sp.]